MQKQFKQILTIGNSVRMNDEEEELTTVQRYTCLGPIEQLRGKKKKSAVTEKIEACPFYCAEKNKASRTPVAVIYDNISTLDFV